MNKERVFETIEVIEEELLLLEKRKTEMETEIKEKCLKLLEEIHGITVDDEITPYLGSEVYRISNIKINPCNKNISYRLEGFPKQRDGKFGKKEYFIKYIYIERNEDE